VHAWYILKKRHLDISRPAFKIALSVALIASLAQLFTGDRSAVGVAQNQPAKLATLEGHYDSLAVADLYLFGWVDQKAGKVSGLAVPGGLTFLLHQDFHTPVRGLNSFPASDRPTQVNAVFQFYHLMILIGMLLIGLSLLGAWLWWRGTLFDQRWLMKAFVWAVVLPQIANQAGWFTAEMGRQPWVVYGLLRTGDAFSRTVTANQILTSLILFTVVYIVLFILFMYLLNHKIQHGPEYHEADETRDNPSRRENPLMKSK
jgi:cytochrome d ubiquinol oxidase subunit I